MMQLPTCHRLLASALALQVVAGSRAAMGQDCNGNGKPDDQDLRSEIRAALSQPVAFPQGTTTALLDLERDGDLDLVACSRSEKGIVVARNAGAGRFEPVEVIPVAGFLGLPWIVDLDGDGDEDLVTHEVSTAALLVVENEAGRMGESRPIPFEVEPHLLAIADLDGDAAQDLIAGVPGAHAVTSLRNEGQWTFGRMQTIGVPGRGIRKLHAADLDQDQAADVLAMTAGALVGNDPPALAVLRNQGDGRLAPALRYDAGVEVSHSALLDADGDGATDVVTARYDPPDLGVLLNTGRGQFPHREVLPSPGRIEALATFHADGDGSPDLVADIWAPQANGGVLLANQGGGQFVPAAGFLPSAQFTAGAYAVGDVDGDGNADLLTGYNIELLQNRGNGLLRTLGWVPTGTSVFAFEDLDGDADFDLVFGQVSSLGIALNSGAGLLGLPHERVWPVTTSGLQTADVNGDGLGDVLTRSDADVFLAQNRGRGDLDEPRSLGVTVEARLESLTVVDFDGDQHLDLLLDVGDQLRLSHNDGSEAFSRPEPIITAYSPPAAADMDGDGDIDVVTFQQQLDSITVFRNQGESGFVPGPDVKVNRLPSQVQLVDQDGDGDVDLFALTSGGIHLLRNRGDGTFEARLDTFPPAASQKMGIADLDGDGTAELLVTMGFSSGIAVYRAPPRAPLELATRWEIEVLRQAQGDIKAADLDGDGQDEVALYASGALAIIYSASLPPVSRDDDLNGIPDECEGRSRFHRGDADGNGSAAISDAVSILGFLFTGQVEPACKESADVDNDGAIALTDAVSLLGYLFLGSAPPAPPGPPPGPCGSDPDPFGSPGDLGCTSYASC